MFKMYGKVILQVGVAFLIYYALRTVIESDLIIIGILVGIIVAVILYGVLFLSRNPADLLDIVCNVEKYNVYIEKFKDDENIYSLLKAYGYIHTGSIVEARESFNKVNKELLKKEKNIIFIKTAIELELKYDENDTQGFYLLLEKAKEEKVFVNVLVPNEIFDVHLEMLNKNYSKAEEVAKEVIPNIKKRLYVIELETLLAESYFEQNKLDDCSAVSEFVVEKNYNLKYTEICKKMFEKVNRK